MDTSTETPRSRHASQAHADHIGNMGTYLYQIRNMLAWILILVGLMVTGGVITGIVIASHSPAVTCQSQGGTNASC